MNKVSAVIVSLFVMVVFCAVHQAKAIDVYMFKKDRADQSMNGNQGYLSGQAPSSESLEGRKRTLIGIDIDLSGTSSSAYDKKVEPTPEEKPVAEAVEPTVEVKETPKETAPNTEKEPTTYVNDQYIK